MKMRPLSILSFIKGSFSKMLPMIITVSLSVAILYFMVMFVEKLQSQSNEVMVYPSQNMSCIYGGRQGISDEDMQKINSNIGASKSFVFQYFSIKYHNLVGATGASIMMLNKKDITSIMDMQKFELIDGKLPEKPKEIIIHKSLALDFGLKVGSVVKKNTKDWYFDEDTKIVGIFEGKAVMGIGMEDESWLRLGEPYVSLAIGGDKNSLKSLNEYIETKLSKKYSISTLNTESNFVEKFTAPIKAMELFIGIILVCVIGVFLVNITNIQYSVRRKELELLHAIGYTRKYILKKSLSEIGVAAFIGYLGGITLTIAIGWGINICFLNERGLGFHLIMVKSMFIMLLVPLAITLFSIKAPFKLTKFRDIV